MTINEEARKKILNVLLQNRGNFDGSDAQYALSFGINKGVYNRLKKTKQTERLLSDAKWITIARKLGVQLGDEPTWNIARTRVFDYLTSQMAICKAEGLSGQFCDDTEVGKTEAAKWFCAHNKNAVYIDCSQHKTKHRLIRAIAQGFGVNYTGKYHDVFQDLAYTLKIIQKPFVALDEAGQLDQASELELIALWNAAPYHCGWYKLGADGLKKKLEKARDNKKVGYSEIMSRYGTKFNKVYPVIADEKLEFWKEEALIIIEANVHNGTDIQKLLTKAMIKVDKQTNLGSNRALRTQILKLKRQAFA